MEEKACEASSNLIDIIKRNVEENKSILSEIMKDYDDKPQIAKILSSKKARESRKSLMQFIEIRRNPGRRARSYASNIDENVLERMPSKTNFSSRGEDSIGIFERNSIESDWKFRPHKEIRVSAPLSQVRRPEDITEEEIDRVVIDPRVKKNYKGNRLSTCHQCRQKTQDMKTICRSGFCRGVQGQFCGICLYNRYGENAKQALLEDNWCCPVCRNICNCSFCLPKKGKPCTGIMVPEARKHGFTNVHSFLNSMSDLPEDESIDSSEDLAK